MLRGFSVGLSGGFLRYSSRGGPTDAQRVASIAPTLGVVVDYNWMLGVNRRFLVGTGVGAKRVLARRRADRADVDRVAAARFVSDSVLDGAR